MHEPEAQRRFADLLSVEDRQRLIDAAATREFGRDATIIAADEPPGEMFLILSGEARVSVFSEDGKEISYCDLGPGDIFGELALLDDQPRSAFVTAVTPLRAAALRRADFERLVRGAPQVALAMNVYLAAKLRSMTTRVLERSTMLVPERLARELVRRAERTDPGNDRAIIRPMPPHADLAARIDTHREAVTKELGRLAREGLIVRDGDALIIPSLRDLLGRAAVRA